MEGMGLVNGPREEARWERREPEEFPPEDVPILAPDERTRPGFALPPEALEV